MASFTTDPVLMTEKATTLEQFADEYDSIRGQLRSSATGMGQAYESNDNRTYTERIEEFCDNLARMSEKLRGAAATLREQANMYTSREEDNTAAANRLP